MMMILESNDDNEKERKFIYASLSSRNYLTKFLCSLITCLFSSVDDNSRCLILRFGLDFPGTRKKGEEEKMKLIV